MDDKKKFEIEFEDDFDSWLAQHEKETKDLKPAAASATSHSSTSASSWHTR